MNSERSSECDIATEADIILRVLAPDEEAHGYQVLVDTVTWLRQRDIKLWEHPLPREAYASRHARGENYGLFVCGELAVIASLAPIPPDWTKHVTDPNAPWLSTLAIAPAFRGRKLGRYAVERIADLLRERKFSVLYLDCAPGFLETFYKEVGFEAITRKERSFSNPHRVFECVLMQRPL